MRRVYKYEVNLIDYVEVVLPRNAQILKFEMKNDRLFLWAMVSMTELPETRRFCIAGTGHDIDDEDLVYINSFRCGRQDFLIFHVFEVI